jgi:hypothetical protein
MLLSSPRGRRRCRRFRMSFIDSFVQTYTFSCIYFFLFKIFKQIDNKRHIHIKPWVSISNGRHKETLLRLENIAL